MLPSLPQVVIRQAISRDISDVIRFIDQAILVHRNLDWQPLTEWVTREPFLLRFENNRLTSFLSCAPDPEGVAWIHAFASDYWASNTDKIWKTLLEPAVDTLRFMQSNLYTVVLNDWYRRLLEQSGFRIKQNIIVLEWDNDLPPVLPSSTDMMIRPMEQTDLDAVVEIDHLAFAPPWALSPPSMEHAYMTASHASVAEVDDRVVGYELSTSNHFSAHLTRLAVSPANKLSNIGYSLTREMLEFFRSRGIRNITVNTQDDNTASIGLYKKLGFKPDDESFPIYWLEIIS